MDIVEFHQRPVTGARFESLVADFFEERDRRLPAQSRERSVPDRVVKRPELHRAQVDVRQWDHRGRLAVDAGCDAPVCDAHRCRPVLGSE